MKAVVNDPSDKGKGCCCCGKPTDSTIRIEAGPDFALVYDITCHTEGLASQRKSGDFFAEGMGDLWGANKNKGKKKS